MQSNRAYRLLAVLLGLFSCAAPLFAPGVGEAYTFGANIATLGSEQTVFDWTTDSCESDDIPDLPARAFRDYAGRTQMIDTHWVNHRYRGWDLNGVKHSCASLLNAPRNGDPSAYDDLKWMTSPYTIDGMNIFSLLHVEYRGWDYPGQCDPNLQGAARQACLYMSVAAAKSTDGGNTYTRRAAPDDMVAMSQYRYTPTSGPAGFFMPSNIVYRPDGYYYVMLATPRYGSQLGGTCLLRTHTLWDPASWRAWDGQGFTVRFIDPYIETSEPAQNHLCQPLPNLSDQMSASLTYNTYLGKYIVTSTENRTDPQTGARVTGFWYSLSDDLIHWSVEKLLMEGPTLYQHQCGEADPVQYPSLLDPTSPERNYGTTGQEPYLYYTRMHFASNGAGVCYLTLDRDLLRIWIRFTAGGAPANPPNCFNVTGQPSLVQQANNRWVLVSLRSPSQALQFEVYGVKQDEPTNGIANARYADRPDQVRVRATSRPDGDGRVYRINFIATGGTGTCWGTAKVGIARSGRAVDTQSQAYDSLLSP
jgi:hypothetical protein